MVGQMKEGRARATQALPALELYMNTSRRGPMESEKERERESKGEALISFYKSHYNPAWAIVA